MYHARLWGMWLLLWTSLMLPSPLSSAALPLDAQILPAPAPAPAAIAMITPPDIPDTLQVDSFKEAVGQWMKQLAEEPGYSAWKQAAWTEYPLGPGTHGWIVLVQSGGQDVGYMVIHAADPDQPGKYQLTEYGSGGEPLFSMQTLHRSLVQLELIRSPYTLERWYQNPLYALWIVQAGGIAHYLDAITGESLPLEALAMPQKQTLPASPSGISVLVEHRIQKSLGLPGFDPYEKLPWVQGAPARFSSTAELQGELEQRSRLTFTAELYAAKIRLVAAVSGFQQWSNNETFLLLEQHGQRAISYSLLSQYGQLFR